MQDITTQRLLLHVKSIEEMERGMLDGDEMSMDFYHAYKYHEKKMSRVMIWSGCDCGTFI